MKAAKSKKRYWGIIIFGIVLLLLIILSGLVYWKINRITQSIYDSAKKANSQNTPLSD